MDDTLKLNSKNITDWFNAVRNSGCSQHVLDAFWSGQIDSKCWLVNKLNTYVDSESNIYIFGGWIGVLASMIFQCSKFNVSRIINVDIDPRCEKVSYEVCNHNINKFTHMVGDMKEYTYNYEYYPDIVINTSTEHVDQETYDLWFDRIPNGSLIAIQGNNFFECDQHIRCSTSLVDFKRMNYANKPLYEGILPGNLYDRYMCIFKK